MLSIMVFIPALVLTESAPPSASDPTKQISHIGIVSWTLLGRLSHKDLTEKLNNWKRTPLYQQLSAADELVNYLLKEDRVETLGYRWEKGTHDRNRVAGRAAWMLEELLNFQLPAVEPNATAEDLKAIHQKAVQMFEEHRAAELTRMAKGEGRRSIADLKKAYHRKLKVGDTGDDTFKNVAVMDQLLREWFPLGKKIKQLEEITGVKGTKEGDTVTYVFDTGHLGIYFIFRLQDGVIRRVEIHP